MNFVLHGITLALAWFLAVNIAVSLCVACVARRTTGTARARPAAFWFSLRILPAAAAAVFVATLFLPSYWIYEPREFVEGFDLTLTACALGGLALGTVALARGLLAWWRACERARVWMQTARPLALPATLLPAFEIEANAPIMALVGIARPRLLVTRGLLEALTPEELEASVAHEMGHRRGWDNLKRLIMRAAPDVLASTSVARGIERRWASASELEADRLAGADRFSRCALASALVKVARLMPSVTPHTEPVCTLVGGGEIASRVERLVIDPCAAPVVRPLSTRWSIAVALLAASVVALSYGPLVHAVHAATEVLVNSLP
jgi:Zn-dependent protease with chaperone function